MVAGHDDAVGPLQSYPAGSLKSLCRLVNKEGMEVLPRHKTAGRSGQRRSYHAGIGKKSLSYVKLQGCRPLLEAGYFLMQALAAMSA